MDLKAHIEALKRRVRRSGFSQMRLAELSGGEISGSWINKFANGHRDNSRVDTLLALEEALKRAKALAEKRKSR